VKRENEMKLNILLILFLIFSYSGVNALESATTLKSLEKYSVADFWGIEASIEIDQKFSLSGILIKGDRWFYLFDGFDDVIKYDFSRALIVDVDDVNDNGKILGRVNTNFAKMCGWKSHLNNTKSLKNSCQFKEVT